MTAREASLKAVAAWRKSGAWSDSFLGNLFARENMSSRDKALASRICYGVLQNLYLCDFYIESFSSIKQKKLEPLVRDILRISVYQILFLERVPDRAVVDEAVTLARRYSNKSAAGYVNALLRRLSTEKNGLPHPNSGNIIEDLSVEYSHPAWIVAYLIEKLGVDGCVDYLREDNSVPGITAFVNHLRSTVNGAAALLEEDGIKAVRDRDIDDMLVIQESGRIEDLRAFSDGYIFIQDAAANLAVRAAAPKAGMTVIDGCAAPGGKTAACAVMMEDKGRIIAFDIHEKKLERVRRTCGRLGIGIVETVCADSREEHSELTETADVVIADVPCSGLGVIRKKPEIRYKTFDEIKELPNIQFEILSNLSKYVKPGGVLLYSTCTILERENEDVVGRFLDCHTEFEAETFEIPKAGRADRGFITLYPHINGTDGFFICRMKRKTGA